MLPSELYGKLLVALLLPSVLGLTACKNDSRAPEAGAAASDTNVRVAVFRVEGMTCASCNVTVKVAAERVRGVVSARADSSQGRAWVTFDPTLATVEKIAAAISETGYKATPSRGEEASPPRAAPSTIAAASKLEPWQPTDEAFRGCEGGCGLRVASSAADVVRQPGARLGQRIYCPVSGVVFEVKESTPRRDVNGQLLYFCCEACAQYFDGHRERILALRGLSSSG